MCGNELQIDRRIRPDIVIPRTNSLPRKRKARLSVEGAVKETRLTVENCPSYQVPPTPEVRLSLDAHVVEQGELRDGHMGVMVCAGSSEHCPRKIPETCQ